MECSEYIKKCLTIQLILILIIPNADNITISGTLSTLDYEIGFRGKSITCDGPQSSDLRFMIGTINAIGYKGLKAYEESGIAFDNGARKQMIQILLDDPTITDIEKFEMEEWLLKEI